MKHLLLYLLLLAATVSYAQPYQDITSDWCKLGLHGKVKEMHITERDTNSRKRKRPTYKETILKFSDEGYIVEEIVKKKKKTRSTTYQYLQEYNREKLTVYARYSNKPKRVDTIVYVIVNDTLVKGYRQKKGEPFIPKQFTYNRKQQMMATQYPSSPKKYQVFKITQDYNDEGYLYKSATVVDDRTFSNTTFTVIATDEQGNPTHIKTEYNSYTCHYSLSGSQYITYTYYE
ncbi:MAG: hypothetical protein R2800_08120 [Flavipsychrobacter sp.]